ncbi:MAG: glycosyltransferase family 2 protein [Candidatus Levybacteria bacterium]|nr:glycosyltransferase family 2 protein [Candidatus Levybacteria bacterium]
MQKNHHTLSVVLATYNEEKNINDCLTSVMDLADEIVIVDGGSTDKTVEITESFGAVVIKTHNPQIFHVNKQKAIDRASKDWILQLDADERVSGELAQEIVGILKENERSINGFWIPRKNYFLGRFLMKGGQYPDYSLRLYRRGKGKLPQRDVHEQAVVEGRVGHLQNPLIHMADPTFGRYILRFNRYIDLFATQIAEEENAKGVVGALRYLLISPLWWFTMTYVRHKGFMDSWQGFVFSFFSALRFPVAYIKYLRDRK